MNIHITRDGQQYGPYSIEDIRTHLATGVLLPTDYAFHEGMTDWAPLEQVLSESSMPVLPPAPTESNPAGLAGQPSVGAVAQPATRYTPKLKKGKRKDAAQTKQTLVGGSGGFLKKHKTGLTIVVAVVVIAVAGMYVYKGLFGTTPPLTPEYGSAALDSAMRKATGKTEGELTKADLEKVTEFTLTDSRLTDADLATVAGLTQLKKLDLSYNGLTDVSALKTLTKLEELLLNENQLTDISALENLKQLKALDVSNNSELDADQIAKLQKKLKKCEITHTAPE